MVWVSARMTFSRVLALVLMFCVCCLNVIPRSRVTPRIVGVLLIGIGVLKRVTTGWVLYSLLYGVMSVRVDLVVDTVSLLSVSQFSSC